MLDLDDSKTWTLPSDSNSCPTPHPSMHDNSNQQQAASSSSSSSPLSSPSLSSLSIQHTPENTPEKSHIKSSSPHAQRRWWLLKNTFSAGSAFNAQLLLTDDKENTPSSREAFCEKVRKRYGMLKFLTIYGDVSELPPRPR